MYTPDNTPDNTIHLTTYTISYQVELAVSHTEQRTWVRSSRYGHDAGPGRTVHELVMLTAGKPYYVRVRYRDQMGWSASSKTAHFGLRYVLGIKGRDEYSLLTTDWYSNIGHVTGVHAIVLTKVCTLLSSLRTASARTPPWRPPSPRRPLS